MKFWRRWFSRKSWEGDMSDELRFHVEQQTNANIAAGTSPDEARRRAALRFGALEGVKEDCREERSGFWFASFWADVRYGLRILRKNPGFTAVAILTLALGIGAATSIFTLADAVLLRPLPYAAPDQLVWLDEQSTTGEGTGVSWPNFQDWNRLNTKFSGMAGYRDARLSLAGDTFPELISGRYVTAHYFDLMGGAPILGRTFLPEENVEGGPELALLSFEFWQQRYGGSPEILGKSIRLDDKAFTIVGVMPRGFGAVTRTALWAPFEQNVPKLYLTGRAVAWLLYVVGRTKPGVSLEQARSDMNRVGDLLAREYPDVDAASRPVLKDLTRYMLGDNRAVLMVLAVAVALLFFITCSNLASLLLVKTSTRQREFVVRLALGASKRKVLQQLFVEGALLSLAGGVLGSLFAWTAVRVAAVMLPKSIPLVAPLHVDARAFLFIFTVTVVAAFALGFAPARFAMRANLQDVLRSSAHQVRGGHRRVHAALMICEVGLAMAVLVGAGLLARTMIVLLRANIGFEPKQLLTASITFPRAGGPDAARQAQFVQRGIDRIQQLPGVESAAAVFPVPFTPQIYQVWLAIQGRVPDPSVEQATYVSVVSANYFQTMKVAVQQGRTFSEQDRSTDSGVVVIDRVLANRYWPRQNPIGKSLKLFTEDFSDPKIKPYEVIGVVEPVRAGGLDEDPQPRVYALMDHMPVFMMSFVVRTKTDPQLLSRDVQDSIRGLSSNTPVFDVRTMDNAIQSSQESRRLAMLLLLSFSVAALLLASIGLYGVVSYLVAQRTNEIGIRMALGAHPRDVAKLILGYGAALVGGGVGLGLVAALALTQVMRTLLFGVKPWDPLTLVFAASTMVIVTLAACYMPARRAMRVDPMIALRYE
jgi:putative ABC transport system permease protein